MYKIVPITALPAAESFISSDQIVRISNDRTSMAIDENDYAHKNKSYLSSCIDNADSSLNAYLSSYNLMSSTYITGDLQDIYVKKGDAILKSTLDTILTSDAYLTKDECKTLEAECIAYINELKNKAVSIIMAKLNESFISQNSVNRPVYGQKSQNGQYFAYVYQLLKSEQYDNLKSQYDFDFEAGEFSLARLLFDGIPAPDDSWSSNYSEPIRSYFQNNEFETMDEMVDAISSDIIVFNPKNANSNDYKIVVPEGSFDFEKKQSIPIAQLVLLSLKAQIKQTITRICNNYAALMISVPQYISNT